VGFVDNALVARGNHRAALRYQRKQAQRRSHMFLTFMMKLYVQLQLFFHRKEGATANEYVILVAVIALVVLAAGQLLGPQIADMFERIGDALT
jgi:pilus assembly protein Flp/PilA